MQKIPFNIAPITHFNGGQPQKSQSFHGGRPPLNIKPTNTPSNSNHPQSPGPHVSQVTAGSMLERPAYYGIDAPGKTMNSRDHLKGSFNYQNDSYQMQYSGSAQLKPGNVTNGTIVNKGNYTTKHNPSSINNNSNLVRQATSHARGPSGQQSRNHQPQNSNNGAMSNQGSTFSSYLKGSSERVISYPRGYA